MEMQIIGEPNFFPRCKASENELLRVLRELNAETIDDSEDLFEWFVEHGPSLIQEVLTYRGR